MLKKSALLITLIAFAIIFRFYNIQEWLFFGMDQEYEAFVIQNILSFRHIPLIGVNAGDTGLYLGPLFIYFATVPYALFNGSPIGGALTASVIGVATVIAVYKLGSLWWGRKIGYIGAFLYASSFLASLYDRQFWNPTPIPFLTVIILYAITKIVLGNIKYTIVVALALGFALQSHLQAVLILIVTIIAGIQYRNKLSRKYVAIFFSVFFAFQIPLVIFDIRHDFTNARAFKEIISSTVKKDNTIVKTTILQRYQVLINGLGRSLYIQSPVDLFTENGQCKALTEYSGKTNMLAQGIVTTCIFLFAIYVKQKKNKDVGEVIITIIFVVTCVGLVLYNRRVYEYYFIYLLPIIYLCESYVLFHIFKKKSLLILPFLVLFLMINLNTLFSARMTYSFKDKIEAIQFAAKYTKSEDFDLNVIGDCGIYGGYRYLFEYFGNKPNASYMDQYFAWIYGNPKHEKASKTVILSFVDPREGTKVNEWRKIEKSYLKNMIAQSQFGKIRVIVKQNE